MLEASGSLGNAYAAVSLDGVRDVGCVLAAAAEPDVPEEDCGHLGEVALSGLQQVGHLEEDRQASSAKFTLAYSPLPEMLPRFHRPDDSPSGCDHWVFRHVCCAAL